MREELVFKASQVTEMDSYVIEGLGMPSGSLMELASAKLSTEISEESGRNILVLCGGGNNGGDGYAVARQLSFSGKKVDVFQVAEPGSELCRLNSKLYIEYSDVVDKVDDKYDMIVDAVFGSGFRGKLSDEIRSLFNRVNSFNGLKIAVDVPSGVNGNTGEVDESSFMADLTLAIGALKTGYYSTEALYRCGEIRLIDIGLFLNREKEWARIFNRCVLPDRSGFSHKGDSGKVYVLGGSKSFPGAPIISARAAISSGAGLVYCSVPDDFKDAYVSNPDVLFRFRQNGSLSEDEISFMQEKMDCLVCGPGCSDDIAPEDWKELFKTLENKTIIIDADIFKLLSPEELDPKNTYVLTPHLVEFSKFSGISSEKLDDDIFSCIDEFVDKYPHLILVLKKPGTIVASKEGKKIVPILCDALSKGGSGDILAGMLGAFLAQRDDHPNLLELISSVVFIHVKTGKKISSCRYSGSVRVRDIIENIGGVIYEETGKAY